MKPRLKTAALIAVLSGFLFGALFQSALGSDPAGKPASWPEEAVTGPVFKSLKAEGKRGEELLILVRPLRTALSSVLPVGTIGYPYLAGQQDVTFFKDVLGRWFVSIGGQQPMPAAIFKPRPKPTKP